MLLARCHIPGCPDTAGRRGFMCALHWSLVPKGVKLRHRAACRAYDSARRQSQQPPAHARPWETGAECIRQVLVQLWTGAFTNTEECGGLNARCCGCPICEQARVVAPVAYAARHYVESRTHAGLGEVGASFRVSGA